MTLHVNTGPGAGWTDVFDSEIETVALFRDADEAAAYVAWRNESECLCELHGGVFCNGCPRHDPT